MQMKGISSPQYKGLMGSFYYSLHLSHIKLFPSWADWIWRSHECHRLWGVWNRWGQLWLCKARKARDVEKRGMSSNELSVLLVSSDVCKNPYTFTHFCSSDEPRGGERPERRASYYWTGEWLKLKCLVFNDESKFLEKAPLFLLFSRVHICRDPLVHQGRR